MVPHGMEIGNESGEKPEKSARQEDRCQICLQKSIQLEHITDIRSGWH